MRASDQPRLTLCVAGAGASLTQGGDLCGALLLAETAAVLLAGGAVECEAKKHSSISLQVGKTSVALVAFSIEPRQHSSLYSLPQQRRSCWRTRAVVVA